MLICIYVLLKYTCYDSILDGYICLQIIVGLFFLIKTIIYIYIYIYRFNIYNNTCIILRSFSSNKIINYESIAGLFTFFTCECIYLFV